MNFFRTVFQSCSHFQNYRTFRDQPVSAALKYIIQLITLLSLGGLLSLLPLAANYTDAFATWADKHLPAFAIKDGRVTTAVPQPYRAGNRDFLFILDTTGQTQKPETNALRGLLVDTDHFTFWVKNTNTAAAPFRAQRAELRGFPDGTVNGQYFRNLIHAFAWVGLPVLFVVITLVALLTVLIQAYIFAFVASLMERHQPHGLRLPQLLNIAIHAATPAALIYTVYQALRLDNIDLWLVYLIIYGVYVVGAANACRDHRPAPKPEENELL